MSKRFLLSRLLINITGESSNVWRPVAKEHTSFNPNLCNKEELFNSQKDLCFPPRLDVPFYTDDKNPENNIFWRHTHN